MFAAANAQTEEDDNHTDASSRRALPRRPAHHSHHSHHSAYPSVQHATKHNTNMNSRPAHVDHTQEHTPRKKKKVSTTDSYGETVRHVHKNGEFDQGTISTIEVRNSAALCLASMRSNFVSVCVRVCILCYSFLVPCFTGSIISLSLFTVF